MPRFSISHHTGSPEGDHYDLFIEEGGALRTWRLSATNFDAPQPATRIQDHRLIYLERVGEVSGNRGRVTIWDQGDYHPDAWTDRHVQVALAGSRFRTRLRLDKLKDDPSDPAWIAIDPTIALRAMATTFLRTVPLEPAPEPALESIQTVLLDEERRLLAAVDRFCRGLAIEWPIAPTDADARDRLQKERSRWRHPWLDQGVKFAEGLDKLATELRP